MKLLNNLGWAVVVAGVLFLGYTVIFGFNDTVLEAVERGSYGNTPTLTPTATLTVTATPGDEWYDVCEADPVCNPAATYTPRPTPTCRPTLSCEVTPYPTATDYPPQP